MVGLARYKQASYCLTCICRRHAALACWRGTAAHHRIRLFGLQYSCSAATAPYQTARQRQPKGILSPWLCALQALGLLFDPAYSVVRLRGIEVTGPHRIEADFLLGGYLRFPWHPRVEPFVGGWVGGWVGSRLLLDASCLL